MRRRYGLEPDDLIRMYEDQNYNCYICSKPSGDTKHTQLYVDHNHSTGKVRKLLCSYCNWIVGVIESQRYKRAVEYIKEHARDQ